MLFCCIVYCDKGEKYMHSGIIKGNVKAHPMEEKDIAFLRLWDLYNGILTDNQREITNLYFNYDLSLGEIAEQ